MSGTVNISRRLFDSEAFRDEPFTEREAWVWLVMEASWKDRTVRAGDYVTETKRGQLAASVRFMAKAWSWTPAKVQRYLKRVEKLNMVCSKSDTGVTVITICNYDKYQNGGQAADTRPIQDRYRTDTNEKKDERREEGKEQDVRLPFETFWNVWPNKDAKKAASSAWNKLSQQDRIAAFEAVRDGWFERWRRSKPNASPILPASFLNGGRWADEIQPQFKAISGGRHEPDRNSQDGKRPDRALANIARLAGLGTASGDGGA